MIKPGQMVIDEMGDVGIIRKCDDLCNVVVTGLHGYEPNDPTDWMGIYCIKPGCCEEKGYKLWLWWEE